MKILVTGANGFIGKNLIAEFSKKEYQDRYEVLSFDLDTEPHLLDEYVKKCEFVIHLAGVNRPQDVNEYMNGNYGFTTTLLNKLEACNNKAPILITSSIQAVLDNHYGLSKKAAEDYVIEYGKRNNIKTLVYRLPNVFGKWCKPNYNSVIATFCYNIANQQEITINDENKLLSLVYVDDVIQEFFKALDFKENRNEDFCYVEPVYKKTLGEIANLIYSFKDTRCNLKIPDMSNLFVKKLYSTYLSYLPNNSFSYILKMNCDNRGSFTEMIRTQSNGQVSINISKPGIVKGNHWHHTKNEKFLVVSGKGVIRFRNIFSDKIIEYFVSGDKLEVVDVPCGYTHNIENLGETDMVTIMWCNECFDPENPDTIFLEV